MIRLALSSLQFMIFRPLRTEKATWPLVFQSRAFNHVVFAFFDRNFFNCVVTILRVTFLVEMHLYGHKFVIIVVKIRFWYIGPYFHIILFQIEALLIKRVMKNSYRRNLVFESEFKKWLNPNDTHDQES